ncbi:hypothetical protein Tco_1028378 [Tanacetum coccineum]|uniref:Uncharacterized protein n=1 Tax=Tanacetum coccineum TaxID=301880 RepID=A0ABQ5G0I2_9ASTR
MDEIVESKNLDATTVVTPSNDKTNENKGVSNTVKSNAVRMNNTSAPIIKDWNSDDERKLSTAGVAVNTVRPVNTANTKAVNTVRSVNTAASKPIVNHPRTKTNAFKRGYSQSLRPFNRHFANKNSIINTNVNTAKVKYTTARDRAAAKHIEYLVGDEAVHKELGDRMERAATTASSLEAEQDSGSGPRPDTILGDVDCSNKVWWGGRLHRNQSNDPPLLKVNTFGSGEDSMQLMELMTHCTKLSALIQALVDWKKIIVNKTSIRRDLKLEDAEGSPCLSNATIFKELTRMGAKTIAWNEFSSTIASAIICLANNQKFIFSKYIFDNMLGDMSKHKKTFVNPSLTKKLFGNIKREGTGFSGKSKRKQRKEAEIAHDETEHEESVPTSSNDPLPSGEDSMQLNDLWFMYQIAKQVLNLEKAKSDQAIKIASLKKRVEKLERRRKFRTIRLQRLMKVGSASRIESSNDSLDAQEDTSKRGRRIKDIDADVEVTLVNETQERQDEDLMFDTRVLDGDEMFVDATTGEKRTIIQKNNESTAGVAVYY